MNATSEQDVASTLMAMERAALDRWSNGDPSGFLEISASDVEYFDPYLDRRLDGLEELTPHYEALRGKIKNKSDEVIDPKVQEIGNVAVLTYIYVVYGENEEKSSMNVTEVYRNDGNRWQIIHTHLAFTKTPKP